MTTKFGYGTWRAGASLAIALGAGCAAGDPEPEPGRAYGTEHHAGPDTVRSGDVRTGVIGTMAGATTIRYEVIDGLAVLDGDILVPWSDFLDPDVAHAATITRNGRWPRGVVPFVIDPALPNQQRVTDAIAHWHQRTTIRLVPRTTETDFVRFVDGGGCSSFVGRIGGQQNITLNAACTTGAAIHEIGHAVGLWHEQSRQDRDSHVIINTANIQPGMEHNFNKYSSGMDIGPYDFNSIMHYNSFAFSVNNQPTITRLDGSLIAGQRNALSGGDLVGVDVLYGVPLGSARDHEETLDLNADGQADFCARGIAGILCSISSGAGFGADSVWSSEFSDANGWNAGPQYYSTIRFPDVNGDGRADVCGRGPTGIRCATSTGATFNAASTWSTNFSDASSWNMGPQYYSTIRFPDLNNDGRADICGRGFGGVLCALSNGTSFGTATIWLSNFSDANGWNAGPQYYGTIRFPDVNNDNLPDVCGRGNGGIHCAINTGAAFGAANLWSTSYSDANSWNAPEYFSTLRFPDLNNDGRADVCGRGVAGLQCALSTGAAFGLVTLWSGLFSDVNSWNLPEYYATIRFPDVNNDDRADVCARGGGGVWCATSNGSMFVGAAVWSSAFSDANGWRAPEYFATIRFPDVNASGRADVCARGGAGILCGVNAISSFGAVTTWEPSFSDANGWRAPEYYTTIQFP